MPPLIQDDEIVVMFPIDGILPFYDLKTATELHEVYRLVLPFETGDNSIYSNSFFGNSELSGVKIRTQIILIAVPHLRQLVRRCNKTAANVGDQGFKDGRLPRHIQCS